MDNKVIGLIGLVIIGYLIILIKKNSKPKFVHVKRDMLLTQTETKFYHALVSSLSVYDDLQIFAQVRIADVIQIPKKRNNKGWFGAFAKISQKHFDFVVCDKNTLEILLAIELHDNSHQKEHRIERDKFVREISAEAGLPLMEIRTQKIYNKKELSQSVYAKIKTYDVAKNRGVL